MTVAPVAIVLTAVLGAGKIDLPRKKPKAGRRMPFGVAKGRNRMYPRVIPHAGFIGRKLIPSIRWLILALP